MKGFQERLVLIIPQHTLQQKLFFFGRYLPEIHTEFSSVMNEPHKNISLHRKKFEFPSRK